MEKKYSFKHLFLSCCRLWPNWLDRCVKGRCFFQFFYLGLRFFEEWRSTECFWKVEIYQNVGKKFFLLFFFILLGWEAHGEGERERERGQGKINNFSCYFLVNVLRQWIGRKRNCKNGMANECCAHWMISIQTIK